MQFLVSCAFLLLAQKQQCEQAHGRPRLQQAIIDLSMILRGWLQLTLPHLAAASCPGTPVPEDDTFPQDVDGTTVVPPPGLLGNDVVPCGSEAVLRVAQQPQFGNVTLSSKGGFTYVSNGQPRDDFFVYKILCDGAPVSFGSLLCVCSASDAVF